ASRRTARRPSPAPGGPAPAAAARRDRANATDRRRLAGRRRSIRSDPGTARSRGRRGPPGRRRPPAGAGSTPGRCLVLRPNPRRRAAHVPATIPPRAADRRGTVHVPRAPPRRTGRPPRAVVPPRPVPASRAATVSGPVAVSDSALPTRAASASAWSTAETRRSARGVGNTTRHLLVGVHQAPGGALHPGRDAVRLPLDVPDAPRQQ